MSKKVQLIIGSTRQNRISPAIAQWIVARAEEHNDIQLEVVDLKDINLPFFNEPTSPSVAPGVSDAAKNWSAKVSGADAYIFLSPEYNAGYPGVLKNAIDYLREEWQASPVSIVTYGFSGGRSSAAQLKQVFTRIGSDIIESGVAIDIGGIINEEGNITETEENLKQYLSALNVMFDEIAAFDKATKEALIPA